MMFFTSIKRVEENQSGFLLEVKNLLVNEKENFFRIIWLKTIKAGRFLIKDINEKLKK
jgi:hypothetical protein